jgi:hypothetical protein
LAAVIHPKFKLCWLDDREENEKKLQKKIISRIEKKLKAIQEEDQSNSSPSKSNISPEEEKHGFFHNSFKRKKM